MYIPPREPSRSQGRLKILRLSRELLTDIFRQGARRQLVIMRGIPDDAELVGVSEHTYFDSGDVALKFRSNKWEDVPEGHPIPEFKIEAHTVDLADVIKEALEPRSR